MSANVAPLFPSAPDPRPRRNRKVPLWAGSLIVAGGVAILLAGGASRDVTALSDALGVPIETAPLPASG